MLLSYYRYLHLSGFIISFDLDSLDPIIILDPQWVIDAFKCLITASKFIAGLDAIEKCQWEEYERSGVLPMAVLKMLFGKYTQKKFLGHMNVLVPAMERLGLLVKPLPRDADDKVDFFVVPCMLKKLDTDVMKRILDDPTTVKTCTLCVKFQNLFIPHAIWDKLIAACIHRFHPFKVPGQESFSHFERGSVAFAIDSIWNMMVQCKDHIMKLTLFSMTKGASYQAGSGNLIRLAIEDVLVQILKMNQQGHLQFKYLLHCSHSIHPDDVAIEAERLQSQASVTCTIGTQPGQAVGHQTMTSADYDVWFKTASHVSSIQFNIISTFIITTVI